MLNSQILCQAINSLTSNGWRLILSKSPRHQPRLKWASLVGSTLNMLSHATAERMKSPALLEEGVLFGDPELM